MILWNGQGKTGKSTMARNLSFYTKHDAIISAALLPSRIADEVVANSIDKLLHWDSIKFDTDHYYIYLDRTALELDPKNFKHILKDQQAIVNKDTSDTRSVDQIIDDTKSQSDIEFNGLDVDFINKDSLICEPFSKYFLSYFNGSWVSGDSVYTVLKRYADIRLLKVFIVNEYGLFVVYSYSVNNVTTYGILFPITLLLNGPIQFEGQPYIMAGESGVAMPSKIEHELFRSVHPARYLFSARGGWLDSITQFVLESSGNALAGGLSATLAGALVNSNAGTIKALYTNVFKRKDNNDVYAKDPLTSIDMEGYTGGRFVIDGVKEGDLSSGHTYFDISRHSMYITNRYTKDGSFNYNRDDIYPIYDHKSGYIYGEFCKFNVKTKNIVKLTKQDQVGYVKDSVKSDKKTSQYALDMFKHVTVLE